MSVLPLSSRRGRVHAVLTFLSVTALFSFASAGAVARAVGAAPPVASAPTYYVDGASTAGTCTDSHSALEAQNAALPWCTISKAVATVPAGAVIRVAPSVYHEQVTLTARDSNVRLQATGNSRPVIEGDWTRQFGIQLVDGVHDVTIDGFELRDFYVAAPSDQAVGIIGLNTRNDSITNNVIHGVHGAGLFAYGIMLGHNLYPGLVHDVYVAQNRIYDVGPGGEAMGIWLLMTTNMTIEGNDIYLCRKEGIRDWYGLNNEFTSNLLYLNWTAITLENAVGDLVNNNVAYANAWAYDPKHVSDPSSLSMWHLATGQWSRFWHNTAYANTHADVSLGQNPTNEDYIDIRDNLFVSPGDVHLHDFPSVRGPHVVIDYNAYSGLAPIYYATWNVPHSPVYSSLPALQSGLGWESHGQMFTPAFANPAGGDFRFDRSTMRPGTYLPDGFGSQVGAVPVRTSLMTLTLYTARVIRSTAVPSWLSLNGSSDGCDDSYWWSTNYSTNGSLTWDLGTARSINTFVLDLYSMNDPRSPRVYSIEVSDDGVHFTSVLTGSNPDNEGSSYKYVLPSAVTARYVRFNIFTNFGASTIIFSDLRIGLLAVSGQV